MLPPPPHNIVLFELDLKIKFPLLRLLKFLSDLKKTVLIEKLSQSFVSKAHNNFSTKISWVVPIIKMPFVVIHLMIMN